MGLSAGSAVRAVCGACALASVIPLAACEPGADTTGVRLTIRYADPPARLRVGAHSESGEQYGPQLLPEPPRRLAANEESVLLQLSADLGGEQLELWAEGLDGDAVVRARGVRRLRVIAGTVVDGVLHLSPAFGCTNERTASGGDGCPPTTPGRADAALPSGPTAPGRDAERDAGVGSAGSGGLAAPAAGSDAPTAGSDAPAAAGSDGAPPNTPDEPMATDSGAPQTPPEQTPVPDAGAPPDTGCEASCDEDAGVAGCACAFDCRKSKDICAPACSAGSTCEVACMEGEHCGISCVDSLCNLDCQRSKECRASCTGDSDCTIKCQRGEDCRAMRCDDGARCLLECDGAKNCAFASCPTGAVSCPGGRVACNRPCPR